jgi:hypothetical protein
MTPSEIPSIEELVEVVNKQTESGSDLDRITVAESLSYELGRLADRITDYFVHKARAAGHSWAEIGKQLGVSKQGAQQRYVVPAMDDEELVKQMLALDIPPQADPERAKAVRKALSKVRDALHFQRFNDAARMIVVTAQTEARELRHPYIGSEHLLLALLSGKNELAARALASLGVAPDEALASIRQELGTGASSGSGPVPFKKEARKALELALRESIRLSDSYIGSEHLLLGLVRGNNRAVALLRSRGVTPEQVQSRVIELLHPE